MTTREKWIKVGPSRSKGHRTGYPRPPARRKCRWDPPVRWCISVAAKNAAAVGTGVLVIVKSLVPELTAKRVGDSGDAPEIVGPG